LDVAISDAMHDLPIPAGSVDRLLARLNVNVGSQRQNASAAAAFTAGVSPIGPAAAPPSAIEPARALPSGSAAPVSGVRPTTESAPANDKTESADFKPNVAAPRRKSLRRWIEVGVLATAATLAAIAYWFSGSSVEFNADEIVGAAQTFAMHETPDPWQLLPANPLPARLARFAFAATSGLTVKPTGWREVHNLLGRSGVAYELRSGSVHATLYVVERDPPTRFAPSFVDLPTIPPTSSLTDSGGKALSAWKQGDLLYVLVVEGGPQQYKAFVAQPGRLAAL
jgi:hypothetical protein